MEYPRHDYSLLRQSYNTPTLAFRLSDADLKYITTLLNSSLDAPNLLTSVNICVSFFSRNHSIFNVPQHTTSYGYNPPLHRHANFLGFDFVCFYRLHFICTCLFEITVFFFLLIFYFKFYFFFVLILS